MKHEFTFTVTIEIDAQKALEKGPKYVEAFSESANEFADEMNEWLEKHPFVQSARMSKK